MSKEEETTLIIHYGLDQIRDERLHQINVRRWTPTHDDQYVNGELLEFARYWLSQPELQIVRDFIQKSLETVNGFSPTAFSYDQKTPEHRLAIAGALIAAELDRVQRAKNRAAAAAL